MSKELMIERIEKAQKEIEAKREKIQQGKFRQNYHFMAETGWINDPNGLIYFKGKYHFFYQYNPYSGFWDCMHWGHAVSEDMIHWEYLPLALAPSEVYDDHLKGGCFSGSAIEHDGKLFLIYTGTCNNGNGFEQAQCIAYSEDGIHFEKYEGNPVITAPEGVPTDLFRDPKVWKHDDTYYVVCGASQNGFAQARLYKSTDMFHWEFVNVLAESRGEWGYMWECPDFYPVGDKYVLMFSPMGGKERTSVYLVGNFDYDTGKFFYTTSGEIDWGFDYYAPQTFEAPDGRRIVIGWMGMPDADYINPTTENMWQHCMSLPRELHWENNRLMARPVEELKALRKNEFNFVCEKQVGLKSEKYSEFIFENQGAALEIQIGKGVCISWRDGVVKLVMDEKTGAGRTERFINLPSLNKIQIFIDASSIEVFYNEGEYVMSTRFYPEQPEEIQVYGCGNGVLYELEPMKIQWKE